MISFDQKRGPPGLSNAKQEMGSMPKRTWTRVLRIIGVMRSQHHPSYFGELTMTLNMFIRPISLSIVVFLALCLGNPSAHAQFDPQNIRAVDASATGNNDGTSWANAYVYLSDAIDYASVPVNGITEIWVAQGVYEPGQSTSSPGSSNDKTATFLLDFNNIKLLAGFIGGEADALDRDPISNVTVLDGQVDDPDFCGPLSGGCFVDNGSPGCDDPDCCLAVCQFDVYCCNVDWDDICADYASEYCDGSDVLYGVYHVVTVNNDVNTTVVLDGFNIINGYADGFSGNDSDVGGGILISDASLAVVRCFFTDNSAGAHGGGAMNITGDSNPIIVNTSFIKNIGDEAGALHLEDELSDSAGGTFVNCLFSENFSRFEGGAVNPSAEGILSFINCTFADNSTDNANGGGAIFTEPNGSGDVFLTNCILWGNLAGGVLKQIEDENEEEVTLIYCDIQGGIPAGSTDGGGNIDDDPLFVDAANGDYRLMFGSPCIEKGNNSAVPCDEFDVDQDGFNCTNSTQPTPDLDLLDRIVNGLVDMGGYEYPDLPCPWDLDGNGVVGISDLLELFAQWGTGGPADFNNDGIVNTQDLLILFANWGPCPGSGLPEPLTLEEELADACLSMDDWNEYVGVMSGSANQATKDRYKCWMEHYLNDCNRCTCLGPVPCPAPDPFDD